MTTRTHRAVLLRAGFVATTTLVWVLASAHVVLADAARRAPDAGAIDRKALVTRHAPVLDRFDPESPLSVGNGTLAITVDVTGLQTFADQFTKTIPLGTLSQWGWHTAPNPSGWHIDRFVFREFDSHGRKVGLADIPGDRRTPEINWLRANPHRLHLGQLAFQFTHRDGTPGKPEDLGAVRQELDLWQGIIRSRFTFDGETVDVETVCHPSMDAIGVRVVSPLLADGRARIALRFPYGTGDTVTADWDHPDAHSTIVSRPDPGRAVFARALDADRYEAALAWTPAATLSMVAPHHYVLTASGQTLSAVLRFAPTPGGAVPSFAATRDAAAAHWHTFWSTGGAIDLSGSLDPRWRELERRIVLSQYLTAIQCTGPYPPQETGLTYNTWEGKFHLEMHWWHAAQFALWGRLPLLESSLAYYDTILPRARATAARQGYAGARWPKMTGPSGDESPSAVGPFLIWQQPHPIFYAELVRRQKPGRETLERFRTVVHETATFMASFPSWDETRKTLVFGPPLQCAQERFPKDRTTDCTYEISYWRWALEIAQQWRLGLGQTREPKWDTVLSQLPPLPTHDGKYLFAGSATDSYTTAELATDHPAVVSAFGILPGADVDRDTMARTFDWIWAHWDWPSTWGWDYPMMAMTAARLGRPDRAIDALLLDTPKNHYRLNGHNHQRPGLTIYLPGNGGLLYAVAMMAAGWDGSPAEPAPGFPKDGRWVVRAEGLQKGL